MLPSAVNVSTLLSEISNVGKLFATRFPKITSEEEGAAENTTTDPFESIPYPFAGDVESCGLCMTPLCDRTTELILSSVLLCHYRMLLQTFY